MFVCLFVYNLTNFESIYESIIYKEIKKKLFTIRANNNKVFTAFRLFKKLGPDRFSRGYKKNQTTKNINGLPAFPMTGLIGNSFYRFRMLQDYLILQKEKKTNFKVKLFYSDNTRG